MQPREREQPRPPCAVPRPPTRLGDRRPDLVPCGRGGACRVRDHERRSPHRVRDAPPRAGDHLHAAHPVSSRRARRGGARRATLARVAGQGRTLVQYDPRGFGLSERSATTASLDASARDLDAVLDRVAPAGATLFAAVNAGPLAIAYAAHYPERVSNRSCGAARRAVRKGSERGSTRSSGSSSRTGSSPPRPRRTSCAGGRPRSPLASWPRCCARVPRPRPWSRSPTWRSAST